MNILGNLFEAQAGRSENLAGWKFVDQLTAAFPKTVSQMKDCKTDEGAEKLLLNLMELAEQEQICDSPHELESLLSWLESLLAIEV